MLSWRDFSHLTYSQLVDHGQQTLYLKFFQQHKQTYHGLNRFQFPPCWETDVLKGTITAKMSVNMFIGLISHENYRSPSVWLVRAGNTTVCSQSTLSSMEANLGVLECRGGPDRRSRPPRIPRPPWLPLHSGRSGAPPDNYQRRSTLSVIAVQAAAAVCVHAGAALTVVQSATFPHDGPLVAGRSETHTSRGVNRAHDQVRGISHQWIAPHLKSVTLMFTYPNVYFTFSLMKLTYLKASEALYRKKGSTLIMACFSTSEWLTVRPFKLINTVNKVLSPFMAADSVWIVSDPSQKATV